MIVHRYLRRWQNSEIFSLDTIRSYVVDDQTAYTRMVDDSYFIDNPQVEKETRT